MVVIKYRKTNMLNKKNTLENIRQLVEKANELIDEANELAISYPDPRPSPQKVVKPFNHDYTPDEKYQCNIKSKLNSIKEGLDDLLSQLTDNVR